MQDTRCCPKEPHAQRSWHLQRSLPAQSEDLRTEVWLAESLDDDERLVEEPATARRYIYAGRRFAVAGLLFIRDGKQRT